MEVQFLGSSIGCVSPYQFLSSFIINETVAIDAGAIGLISPPEHQKRIRHVVLTHSHIDHIASLPLFLDNVYDPNTDCVSVYAGKDLQECLQRDVFNDRLWPDLVRMSDGGTPFVSFKTLFDRQPICVSDLRITPVEVDHVVPCFGFVIEDQSSAVAIVTDTGPTEQIWQAANTIESLKAVFLEASFPNSFSWLAEKSKHLTSQQFGVEVAKLSRDVAVIAIHLKPEFHDQVLEELNTLGLPSFAVVEPGRVYEF